MGYGRPDRLRCESVTSKDGTIGYGRVSALLGSLPLIRRAVRHRVSLRFRYLRSPRKVATPPKPSEVA